MSCSVDLNTPLSKVTSERIDEQIGAMEQLAANMNAAGRLVVEGFLRSSNRFLVAERLTRFGCLIVEPLQEAVDSAVCKEVRVLGSIVLLRLKSYSMVPYLLHMIRDDDEYLSLIAGNLAAAGIAQAAELIVERLRTLEVSRKYDIVGLLTALEKLGVSLPDDIRERFSAPDTPFEIRLSLSADR